MANLIVYVVIVALSVALVNTDVPTLKFYEEKVIVSGLNVEYVFSIFTKFYFFNVLLQNKKGILLKILM